MDYASFIFLFYIASFFRLLSHFVLLRMRPFFVLSLVCFSMALLAQAPVYQSHEVATPAQPKGGFAFLQQFVNSNLQPPLFAYQRSGQLIL
jgi:hypothetical protein